MADEIKESLRILSPGVANGIKDGDESESLLRGQYEALKEDILKTLQGNPDGITLQKLSQVVLEIEQFRILQPLSDYRAIHTDSKLILNLLFEMRNLVFEIKNATEESLFRCRLRSDEPPRIPRLLLVSEKSGLNAIYKMILTTLRKHQSGIHIRQLIKDINQTYGIDLTEYSRDKGFKEVVEFLEKVPRSVLLGSRKSKQCSIHPLPIPGLMTIAGVVHGELRNCGGRMKASKLIKIMQDKYQLNLEKLCQDYFFENVRGILKQVPNIAISKSQAPEKSIIKLLSGAARHQLFQKIQLKDCKVEDAAQSVCELIIASLRKFKSGIRICTLTTHFKLKYALDLKKYSKDLGYRNTVDMFKLIPGIALLNPEKQTRCFIKLLPDVTNEPQRLPNHSPCTAVSPKSAPPNNSTPPNTSVSLPSNEGTEFGSPNLDENGSYGTDENGCQRADENWSQRFYENGSQGTTTNRCRKINCPLIVRLELCKILSSYLGTLWYRTMKLRTLKTKMRLEHGINLDEISRNLGYKNSWNFLQQARNIGAKNPEDPTKCLLYMRKGFHVEMGCSGLCQYMSLCRRRRTLNPQKIKNRIPNYPASMCHQKAKTVRTGFRNRRSKFLESGFVKPIPVQRKVRRHLCFKEVQPKDTKKPLSKPKPSVPVPPGSKNTRKKKKKCRPKRENTGPRAPSRVKSFISAIPKRRQPNPLTFKDPCFMSPSPGKPKEKRQRLFKAPLTIRGLPRNEKKTKKAKKYHLSEQAGTSFNCVTAAPNLEFDEESEDLSSYLGSSKYKQLDPDLKQQKTPRYGTLKNRTKKVTPNTDVRHTATIRSSELNEIFTLIRDMVSPLSVGLKVRDLKTLIMLRHDIDLEVFRKEFQFKDIISFLYEVPGCMLVDSSQGEDCLVSAVQRTELTEIFTFIRDMVSSLSVGLRVRDLKKFMMLKHDIDLEVSRQEFKYKDIISLLDEVPECMLVDSSLGEDCLIRSIKRTGSKRKSAKVFTSRSTTLSNSKQNAQIAPISDETQEQRAVCYLDVPQDSWHPQPGTDSQETSEYSHKAHMNSEKAAIKDQQEPLMTTDSTPPLNPTQALPVQDKVTDESHDLKLCQKISISSIHQPALMYHDEPQKKLFPVKTMKSNAPPPSRILGKGGPSKIEQEKMLMTPAATEPLNPSEWLFSKDNSMDESTKINQEGPLMTPISTEKLKPEPPLLSQEKGNINRRGQQLSRETASKTTNHLHQMESEHSAEHCNSSLPQQHQLLPTTSLTHIPKPLGTNHSSDDPFPSISFCRQTSEGRRDPILKEEILVMLLLRPQGITFGEFASVFRQTHGYELRLAEYGYSSLRSLLDDMKDLVMVVGDPRNPLILPRAHHQFAFFAVEY